MHFRFALGPDLFLSVAQIRAFRALYYRIVLSYGVTEVVEPCILTESSLRYHSEADRHNNLLRSGTAGMAAMTTGVYSFEAWPFSSHEKRNFALRMSRNMLNLMRGESYLEKSQDPFGGSWYIESYTYSLYQKSLEKLQQLSSLGDANDASVQSLRHQEVEASGSAQQVALDTGKLSLLGVNIFPNIREACALDFQIPGAPASIIRLAAPYEHLMETGRQLQGYMLHMVSDVSACQARVDFIQQFMSSCGIREAEGASPLIVICGIDADYGKSETLDWIRQHSATSQVVLAGSPIDSKQALLDAGIRRMITLHSSRIEAASFFHSVLSKQKA
jgi:methylmalonyl-CoA mutase